MVCWAGGGEAGGEGDGVGFLGVGCFGVSSRLISGVSSRLSSGVGLLSCICRFFSFSLQSFNTFLIDATAWSSSLIIREFI